MAKKRIKLYYCTWCGTRRRAGERCSRGPFCQTEAKVWNQVASFHVIEVYKN